MHDQNAAEPIPEVRLEWTEPEIRRLDVTETAFRQNSGNDGETRYSDCTVS